MKFCSTGSRYGWHFAWRNKSSLGTLWYTETWSVSASTTPSCPSTISVHPISQLYCEGSTCRSDGMGKLRPSGICSAQILAGLWRVQRKWEVFSQWKGCTESILTIPAAAVFVLAATAPVQRDWQSRAGAQLCYCPKRAIKRIHLVPNYCIQFSSVLKTWSGKHCARPFAWRPWRTWLFSLVFSAVGLKLPCFSCL